MKKVIAVVFVLITALALTFASSLASFAESAEGEGAEKRVPKAKVDCMVVIGDSISTGYALEGYDPEGDNADISSYANLVASYYGLTLGENYFNYAKNGATSTDILEKLENGLSKEEKENIAKSDVVIVTVGGNDFLGILYSYVTSFLELEENASLDQIMIKLLSMSEDDLENFEKKAETFYKNNEKSIAGVYELVGENISAIAKKLKAISPNAQIYLQSVYNPINELPQYKALTVLNDKIISKMINSLNDEIFEQANSEKLYTVDIHSELSGRKEACTNIADLDIHPNEYGHSLIADALCLKIDTVYDNLNSNDKNTFSEGKYEWLWFAGAAAVVVIAVPIVLFVVKKSSAE